MHEPARDKRHEAILALLDEVMVIMRNGKPFNPENPIFGQIQNTVQLKRTVGMGYEYKNDTIKAMTLAMTIEADPLNYEDDRKSVPVVPSNFFLDFAVAVRGFTWTEIQKRLDLADYWIDSGGKKEEGNCFPASPPNEWITICRYRANVRADSRFPVDVELGFFGPRKEGTYDLDRVTIRRSYPYLTPDIRKQKREEKEQHARDLYGNPRASR
jgi:hypothetical protein